MEFIPFKKNMKGHYSFSQPRGFSQRLGVFAARGISASISQPISQQRNGCTTLQTATCMPKGGFATAKHPLNWCLGCEMADLQAWKKSQPFRSCEMVVLCCEMALVSQGGFSQLRKFSQRAQGGCEMVSQRRSVFAARRGIFAAAPEGCEILQPKLSPCF